MLSYQHIYHAGNLADLMKHGILIDLLRRLVRSPRPLSYVETHAGRGLYHLGAPEALKTGEAREGIERVMQDLGKAGEIGKLVTRLRAKRGADVYPGSPLIARMLLRPIDRIHLMEMHPGEYRALVANLKGKNIRTFFGDGYEEVLRMAPPVPRRGLLLVDPSYEVKSEYSALAKWVPEIRKRWPEASILVWYPVLDAGLHQPMIESLRMADSEAVQVQEQLFVRSEGRRMRGCGLVLLHAPAGYRLPEVSLPGQRPEVEVPRRVLRVEEDQT